MNVEQLTLVIKDEGYYQLKFFSLEHFLNTCPLLSEDLSESLSLKYEGVDPCVDSEEIYNILSEVLGSNFIVKTESDKETNIVVTIMLGD